MTFNPIYETVSLNKTGLFPSQPCQNVPAAGNFAAFSPFLATYSTLDFTMSPLAGKGTWARLFKARSSLPRVSINFDFQFIAK